MRIPLQALNLEGGVWKIKWKLNEDKNSLHDELLVACMYNGISMVHLEWNQSDCSSITTLDRSKHYLGHGDGALLYGIEWLPQIKKDIVATCAFYSKSVHIHEL